MKSNKIMNVLNINFFKSFLKNEWRCVGKIKTITMNLIFKKILFLKNILSWYLFSNFITFTNYSISLLKWIRIRIKYSKISIFIEKS